MPFDTATALAVTAGVSLAAEAEARDRAFFAAKDHHPTAEQWGAIRAYLDTLAAGVEGRLTPHAYVSAMPPGLGKSVSLAMFANVLMERRDTATMLILVNRIDDAKDMAKAVSAHRDVLHVKTSKPSVNALGDVKEAQRARLVITTQEAIRRALKDSKGALPDLMCFWGERRHLVTWDEQVTFNRPVTLSTKAMAQGLPLFLELAQRGDNTAGLRAAERSLSDWAWRILTEAEDMSLVEVPDLFVDFDALEDAAKTDTQIDTIKALRVLDGDFARVKRVGDDGVIVANYPVLPRSILPVVVTDASARANASYDHMASVGMIRWIEPEATKHYGNLRIRVEQVASASRDTFRKGQAGELLDKAAEFIAQVPAGEHVLCVGYKDIQGRGRQVIKPEAMLRHRMSKADNARVSYIHYGNHKASNDYRDVKHVILLALDHRSDADNLATTAASLNLDPVRELPPDAAIQQTRYGTLMDSTLQAVLRGHARTMDREGRCGECSVLVFQTKRHGLASAHWQRMFPGCFVDESAPEAPEGRLKDLCDLVETRLEAGETEITNKSMYEALKMSRPRFFKLVRDCKWAAFLDRKSLRITRLPGRNTGLRLHREE